jgi:hypothetical protein
MEQYFFQSSASSRNIESIHGMIQSPETKLKTVSMISVESGAEISSEI